jgi:Nif-specific regulatory protein
MATENQETLLSDADLNLLYDVSSSISSIQDLDKMLKNILQKIKTEFQVEGASIALHDSARKEFYFIRTVEEQKNGTHMRKDTMRFPEHFGVAGWVVRANSAVIISDISTDDRFSNELDFQQNLNTRSMICVPLKTRNALIGVLYALNKLTGDFSIKESRLLEILSGTIAMAIENARMYSEIKQQADSLVKLECRDAGGIFAFGKGREYGYVCVDPG